MGKRFAYYGIWLGAGGAAALFAFVLTSVALMSAGEYSAGDFLNRLAVLLFSAFILYASVANVVSNIQAKRQEIRYTLKVNIGFSMLVGLLVSIPAILLILFGFFWGFLEALSFIFDGNFSKEFWIHLCRLILGNLSFVLAWGAVPSVLVFGAIYAHRFTDFLCMKLNGKRVLGLIIRILIYTIVAVLVFGIAYILIGYLWESTEPFVRSFVPA